MSVGRIVPEADLERALYNDLSPAEAGRLIGGKSASHVRKLILAGEIEATDVGTGKVPRYVVSRDAIAAFRLRRRVQPRGKVA